MKMKEVNWERLKNPGGIFKLFCQDPNDPIVFHKKWVEFKKMLKTRHLYLDDEYRKDDTLDNAMLMFYNGAFYEIGDFQGMVGFTNIFQGNKCGLVFKIWDKKLFGHNLVKECKRLMDIYFDEFELKRMSTSSPDPKMVKLAKMAGFEYEGTEKCAFKWNDKYFDNITLGKINKVINKAINKVKEEKCAVKEKK
jgi:RimJ/RimL family protein N-acetyltransferase